MFLQINRYGSASITGLKATLSDKSIREILGGRKNIFSHGYSLKSFFSKNKELARRVDYYMGKLSDKEKIAQMVMTSVGENGRTPAQVVQLVKYQKVGGVIFLKNHWNQIADFVSEFNRAAVEANTLKPIFAVDGEPSLLHTRFVGLNSFPPAKSIIEERECRNIAGEIASILKSSGIHINYAPVCDYGDNKEVIGDRSFGGDATRITHFCKIFIKETQRQNIVATAKHFPGHGTISGDSHGRLVVINGIPPELPIFKAIIDTGVLAIMVGHIAVQNSEHYDTQGKPSSLSRKMVTGVLKNELGFKGIVVTDSLSMFAVHSFTDPGVEAAKAGCDIILMPNNEKDFIDKINSMIKKDVAFRDQIMDSVRKIIRLKICLGMIDA